MYCEPARPQVNVPIKGTSKGQNFNAISILLFFQFYTYHEDKKYCMIHNYQAHSFLQVEGWYSGGPDHKKRTIAEDILFVGSKSITESDVDCHKNCLVS